jgi:hypothetical protein
MHALAGGSDAARPNPFSYDNAVQKMGEGVAAMTVSVSAEVAVDATIVAATSAVGGEDIVASRAVARSAVDIGEYAGESIVARSAGRSFTKAERAEINRIGSKTGCHTCGSTNPGTKSGNFVLDHQPASALNVSGGPQRLYPQCINCSREQGLEIARQLSQGGQ